jgi:hypothetical protein
VKRTPARGGVTGTTAAKAVDVTRFKSQMPYIVRVECAQLLLEIPVGKLGQAADSKVCRSGGYLFPGALC